MIATAYRHTEPSLYQRIEPHAVQSFRPDSALRNHLVVTDRTMTPAAHVRITKRQQAAERKAMIMRVTILGGAAISSHVYAYAALVNVLLTVAAAVILWRLGKTEGAFARVMAVGLMVGVFGYVSIAHAAVWMPYCPSDMSTIMWLLSGCWSY